MYSLKITGDIERMARALEPNLVGVKIRTVNNARKKLEAFAKGNARRGRPGLNRRSGKLERAIYARASVGGRLSDEMNLAVGADLEKAVYARIHEFGGTIRPKHGTYLAFYGAGGSYVRVRSVFIPKRAYLEPARATVYADLALIFAEEFARGESQ